MAVKQKTTTAPKQKLKSFKGVAERRKHTFEICGILMVEKAQAGMRLFHGTVILDGHSGNRKRVNYAWIEMPDGNVYEPASDRILLRETFGRLFEPYEDRGYSSSEVWTMGQAIRLPGPWHLFTAEARRLTKMDKALPFPFSKYLPPD